MTVYLTCNNNNYATTVLQSSIQAINTFFIPFWVCCDYGGKIIEVAKFMLSMRGFNRDSVLTESSVHNQRIERLWRDVFQRVTGNFYKLFNRMEEVGILDPLNNVHIYCLHYIFILRIQMALGMYASAWNQHPISGEGNLSSMQLFIKGTHKLLEGGKVAEDFFAVIEDDYGIEETFSMANINMGIHDNTVNITPPEVALTSDITANLSHINPLDNTTSMGVNFYQNVLAYFL